MEEKSLYMYNDSNNTIARTHTHNYHTFSRNTRIIGKYQELIYYNHCYDNDTRMCCYTAVYAHAMYNVHCLRVCVRAAQHA